MRIDFQRTLFALSLLAQSGRGSDADKPGGAIQLEHSQNQQIIVDDMGSGWSNPAGKGQGIIDTAKTVQIDAEKDPRSKRLTYLLRANHINHSLNYNSLRFHNHMPHILGSAYFFGATAEQLNDIYDEEAKTLEPWTDSPAEVSPDEWREFIGDRRYQRAYLDFFEDEMVRRNYDWKGTVMHFLLEGDKPLINGLIGGVGHPLIHLGYAFELENREVAMEALTIAATNYNKLHTFVDNPNPPEPYIKTDSLRTLVNRMREDFLFDGKFKYPTPDNMEKMLDENEFQLQPIFYSFRAAPENYGHVFEDIVDTATLILTTGHKKGDPQFDFFLAHLVTAAHGLRVILPLLTMEQAWATMRSFAVLTVMVYYAQLRPLIKDELLTTVNVEGKDWDYITKKALEGEHRFDAHYVKALRSFMEFEKLFGNKENFYLKAAVKFADEFQSWTGFGAGMPELDIRK